MKIRPSLVLTLMLLSIPILGQRRRIGLNQKKKTILNMGGPGTGGGLWTYGNAKKKTGNKGGLFGLNKKILADDGGLSTYGKKETKGGLFGLNILADDGGLSTYGKKETISPGGLSTYSKKKETSSRGGSSNNGMKEKNSREVSNSIFGKKKTPFTLPKKDFTSSGSDGVDALRLALRVGGKDLKSALSGTNANGGVTGGDSIFGPSAGASTGVGGKGKAKLVEDSCEFEGKGVCSGSVVESFVFGFVRVCVNGKLQVMREEDLQNVQKESSIKGGACPWRGKLYCDGDVVIDLFQWWFLMVCRDGKIKMIPRRWREVVNDPRFVH